jgi:hypothetical protein
MNSPLIATLSRIVTQELANARKRDAGAMNSPLDTLLAQHSLPDVRRESFVLTRGTIVRTSYLLEVIAN